MSAKAKPAKLLRPFPPADLSGFARAEELEAWLCKTFIDEGGKLVNPDHKHLQDADIGCLWTDAANTRQMRTVVGTCEIPKPPNSLTNKWHKARWEKQIEDWFGEAPDFLITIYAPYANECDDASFCALIEHELYHAGQAKDEFGGPKFRRDGTPVWAIRGHDVEEFVGILARYGAAASAAGVVDLVAAAGAESLIGHGQIQGACGACV